MTPVVAIARGEARLAAPSPAPSASRRTTLIVSALVCVAMAAPIAVYLWLAGHRIGYPYELDWMEGGSVELTARAAAGHSLYAAPSLRFVGWTYPPLYYWLTAAVAQLTGIGFVPLRLVSVSASLVSMTTLAWIVVRETGDRIAGLVAAGLFAATFYISGAWFDIGRVDSMFLALTLLTLAVGRSARGLRGGTVVGVLAFLAFFTKQTALLALLPALGYLVISRRRVGITALLTLLVLVVGSTFVLNAATDGWYGYYVFSELVHQPVARQLWVGFWVDDIARHQWPLLILILAGGATLARRPNPRAMLRSPLVYWTCAAGRPDRRSVGISPAQRGLDQRADAGLRGDRAARRADIRGARPRAPGADRAARARGNRPGTARPAPLPDWGADPDPRRPHHRSRTDRSLAGAPRTGCCPSPPVVRNPRRERQLRAGGGPRRRPALHRDARSAGASRLAAGGA